MNKFFIFFLPIFLFSEYIKFPYTIKLKKDEIANFQVKYLNRSYPFKFRWTLYINNVLTILYRYDNFPRQVEVFKNPPMNTFKVKLAKIPEIYPYLYIEFSNFDGKIATFNIYLMNGKKVAVDFKGKK